MITSTSFNCQSLESKNCAQAVWIRVLSNWFSASFDEPYVWVEADPGSCRDTFFIRNPSLWAYPLQYFMKHLPQSVKWSWAISKKWGEGEESGITCEKSAWPRLFDWKTCWCTTTSSWRFLDIQCLPSPPAHGLSSSYLMLSSCSVNGITLDRLHCVCSGLLCPFRSVTQL